MISTPFSSPIRFTSADVNDRFKHQKQLKKVINQIFTDHHKDYESIDYILCSDSFLLDINTRFLQHTDLTDIITFNLASLIDGPAMGEIYISVERVRENAKIFGTRYIAELSRVVFHGALHLCGLKDKKTKEIIMMREKEAHYLKMYSDSSELTH